MGQVEDSTAIYWPQRPPQSLYLGATLIPEQRQQREQERSSRDDDEEGGEGEPKMRVGT